MADEPLITFRLDRSSGLPAYRQLVEQVRQALRLGVLRVGDQLPTVRDVVEQIAINPNTVHRAYRELEQQGLIEGQQGRGTFVSRSLPMVPTEQAALRDQLVEWLHAAEVAGLDDEVVTALIADARRSLSRREEEPQP